MRGPSTYPWHAKPADPRDRAVVLRLARARGIRPQWAGCDMTLPERIARIERILAGQTARGAA